MEKMISNMTFSDGFAQLLEINRIKEVCICPGSRNTPLTLSFLKNSFLNCTSYIDERAAAFFTLGISKASAKPSVILTTSGTAVANLLPAVIEADLSTTPLIIITADRPERLQSTGENQTINQKNIFDKFVRSSIHIEVSAVDSNDIFEKMNDTINSSLGNYGNNPPGPIHINVAFDEPLVDTIKKNKINFRTDDIKTLYKNFNLPEYERPIIICGNIKGEYEANEIMELSKKINAPILADPLSELRFKIKHKNILSYYDFFIKNMIDEPDLIIRFGKKPVSKKLNKWLNNFKNKTILFTKYNGYNDDTNSIFLARLDDIKNINKANQTWIQTFINLEENISNKIKKYHEDSYFYEGNIIYHLIQKMNANDNLFIGNSMSVRNLEKFVPNIYNKINIFSNRGASGIDGLIATGIGVSYYDKENKTNIILGDISFFYDSNSLLIAKQQNININIIIMNNNGGQIFNQLPYAQKNDKNFEKFWITPANLNIKSICETYNANYFCIKSIKEIKTNFDHLLSQDGINIFEVICNEKNIFNIDSELTKI